MHIRMECAFTPPPFFNSNLYSELDSNPYSKLNSYSYNKLQ